jgi:hypothetical protein
MYKGSELMATDAIVRLSDKETYIEISAIHFGHTAGKPKIHCTMEAACAISLRPSANWHHPVDVSFSLNRYSDDFVVLPPASAEDQGVLFTPS